MAGNGILLFARFSLLLYCLLLHDWLVWQLLFSCYYIHCLITIINNKRLHVKTDWCGCCYSLFCGRCCFVLSCPLLLQTNFNVPIIGIDLACYIYTSGTTGLPKACNIKHTR